MEIQWWNDPAVEWCNSYEKLLRAIPGVTIVKKLWDVRVGPKPYFDVFKDWIMVVEYRKYYLVLSAYRRPVAGYTQWVFPGDANRRWESKKYPQCITLRTNRNKIEQELQELCVAGFKEYPQDVVRAFQERVMAKHSINIPAVSKWDFEIAVRINRALQRAKVLFEDPEADEMRSQTINGWQNETEEPLFDTETQSAQPTW